jgi:rhamnopyranosyl-N-acetylglucosaminyl-diphospho-decaprenol beta-1,3/1,4-galactofuranosyltransferase
VHAARDENSRDGEERVCALVVTHNRRALLEQCLRAIERQTRPPEEILVVDNGSTDGTAELVRGTFPQADLVVLEANVGGAGGFHAGLARGAARDVHSLWLMDDDTVPTPSALEALLDGRDRGRALGEPVILASKVVWKDGQLHPMNVPAIDNRRWRDALEGVELGLLPLRSASFVSVLIRRDAVERHGLPLRQYHLWFDDMEYTSRILRDELGFFVGQSVACHMTPTRYASVEGSGERFYYAVRNRIFLLRSPALRGIEKLRVLRALADDLTRYLRRNRAAPPAVRVVVRGIAHGLSTPMARLLPEPAPRASARTASVQGEPGS